MIGATERPGTSTKEKILDTAELLFAERGFGQTSLRDITSAAGVNLAAVNYHFHSKDALIQAICARRIGPLNDERLRLLGEFEARAGSGPLAVRDVLHAFAWPMLCGTLPDSFKRLFGRLYAEPGGLFLRIVREQFGRIRERFMPAFRRALPDCSPEDIGWCVHFTIGTIAHTLAGVRTMEVIAEHHAVRDLDDPKAIASRLIDFLAAGFESAKQRASR